MKLVVYKMWERNEIFFLNSGAFIYLLIPALDGFGEVYTDATRYRAYVRGVCIHDLLHIAAYIYRKREQKDVYSRVYSYMVIYISTYRTRTVFFGFLPNLTRLIGRPSIFDTGFLRNSISTNFGATPLSESN